MKYFKEIALGIAIVLSVFGSTAYIAFAQTGLTTPFGGQIISYVLPTPTCPVAHTLIFDFATFRLLGLSITPSTKVYMNYNFITSGGYVLGNASALPVTCPLPYMILPVLQIGSS